MRGAEKRVEGDGKKGGGWRKEGERMAEGREEIGGGKGRRELRKGRGEEVKEAGVKCENGQKRG